MYYKQAKADEAYWEDKLEEQLEMEGNMEEYLDDDMLVFWEEELDIDDIDLEVLSESDGTIKRDKDYASIDDDEELEI